MIIVAKIIHDDDIIVIPTEYLQILKIFLRYMVTFLTMFIVPFVSFLPTNNTQNQSVIITLYRK